MSIVFKTWFPSMPNFISSTDSSLSNMKTIYSLNTSIHGVAKVGIV